MTTLELSEYWNYIFSIIFNVVASTAAGLAAWQYLKITRGLAKHTELDLAVRPLSQNPETRTATIEVGISIKNASIRNTTFYNLLSQGERLVSSAATSELVWRPLEHITERDAFIRLHAGTSIIVYFSQEIPILKEGLKVSALLPYSSKREDFQNARYLEEAWGNGDDEEYNQVTRWFGPSDLYGAAYSNIAQQGIQPDGLASGGSVGYFLR